MPIFASSEQWDQRGGFVPDRFNLSAETTLRAVSEISSTISTEANSSDDVYPLSRLLGGPYRGGDATNSGAASQARASGAEATPTGSAASASAAVAGAATAPGTAPAAMAAGNAPASSAASAALGTAAAQSLGGGIRPMTMPPAPTAGSHGSGGRLAGTVTPDMGSGGGGPTGPPSLTSLTFGIQMTSPGQYQALGPVPIGAVAGLTTSLAPPTVTNYTWVGGTYTGYVGGPATSAPPPSQAAPTAPVGTGSTYGFIVNQPNYAYTVKLTVTYQGGGQGMSTLTFNSVAPTGSLAVQQVGTQTGGAGFVQLTPPIQISADTQVGANTAGQFMFMQICDYAYASFSNNAGTFYRENSTAFPGFGGPLIDNPDTQIAYPVYYQYNDSSWRLPDAQGNTSAPFPPWAAPYMQDAPGYQAPGAASPTSVFDDNYFSTYLMYQPNIQGSVWIAISEMDWEWSDTATLGAAGWTVSSQGPQPNPTGPTTPSGLAAFPTWVNTTQAYVQVPMQDS